MLRVYHSMPITFSEVPEETSLVLGVTGCPNRCEGCHSPHLWDGNKGEQLTINRLSGLLDKYGRYITCVTFLGGEWEPEVLRELLITVQLYRLKTCLYTGLDSCTTFAELLPYLDYLKVGHYDSVAGPLTSETTNQRMYTIVSGYFDEDITFKFWRKNKCS